MYYSYSNLGWIESQGNSSFHGISLSIYLFPSYSLVIFLYCIFYIIIFILSRDGDIRLSYTKIQCMYLGDKTNTACIWKSSTSIILVRFCSVIWYLDLNYIYIYIRRVVYWFSIPGLMTATSSWSPVLNTPGSNAPPPRWLHVAALVKNE